MTYAAPPTSDPEKSAGIPAWVVAIWWMFCALVALAGWWLVLLMVTFGCDSGWEGCETVGITTVYVYAVIAGVGLTGLLLWALTKPVASVRIAAVLLMPFWVILSMGLSFGGYFLVAQLVNSS